MWFLYAKAEYYADKSNIIIEDKEKDRIMKSKGKDTFDYLNKNFPQFLNYTTDRQKALIDMCYNLGRVRFSKYQKSNFK